MGLGVSRTDEQWKDADVDIFCTWEAAPFVRQRLVERCGLICTGSDDGYLKADQELTVANYEKHCFDHATLSVICHVENYNSRPMTGNTADDENRVYDLAHGELDYASDAYFAQVTQWGAERLEWSKSYQYGWGNEYMYPGGLRTELPKHSKNTRSVAKCGLPEIGVPEGSAGGAFPYDFELRGGSFVQIIIAEPRVKDARELLNSFVLEICKCSFDGNVFRVPDAVKSFAGRTRVTPARHALVDDFMRNVKQYVTNISSYTIRGTVMSNMTKSWIGLGATPLKDTSKVGVVGSSSWFQFRCDICRRYDFITKLIERMQKYDNRGVSIDDAPEGVLGWGLAGQAAFVKLD